MDFHLVLDQKIFKLVAYTLVIFITVLTLGIIILAYMDYEYFKFKINNKSKPNMYQHLQYESVET